MKSIHLAEDKTKCCGCGACMTACPKQAITMEADPRGYLYPSIDHAQCIGCGKCVQTCAFSRFAAGTLPSGAYAAFGNDSVLTAKSASGGIFSALASACMDDGGLAAGAVMDLHESRAEVYHLLSGEKSNLCRMQGSKYVQSEAWRCFPHVQQALKDGRTVLFSGTPCQAAAIREITGDPDNLITVDLVCHGVPPVKMFNDFLATLSRRLRGPIQEFTFRDKTAGKTYCARIGTGNRRKPDTLMRSNDLSFYRLFLNGSVFRESCYACPYADLHRSSDITIGDYWGIEKFHQQDFENGHMPRRKDWSCLLVNSPKGAAFLSRYADAVSLFPTEAAWIAQNNHQLNHPSKKPLQRERLLDAYTSCGYAAVEKDFIQNSGGTLRFYWRMLKWQIQHSRSSHAKDSSHEN